MTHLAIADFSFKSINRNRYDCGYYKAHTCPSQSAGKLIICNLLLFLKMKAYPNIPAINKQAITRVIIPFVFFLLFFRR